MCVCVSVHYILIHGRKKDDDITPLEEYVLWMYVYIYIYVCVCVCTTLPAFKAPTIPQQPPLQQEWQNNHPKSHLISLAQLVIIRSSWMYAMLASRASYNNLKGSSILDVFVERLEKLLGSANFLGAKSPSESLSVWLGVT